MMKNKILIMFGAHIRKLRIERGMSQEQLAEKAQVHRTYVGMLERGEKNATITTLVKISAALNVSINQLFSWENNDDTK